MDQSIDVFCHVLPKRYEEARRRLGNQSRLGEHTPSHLNVVQGEIAPLNYQMLTDLEARFRMMDEFEHYRQLISAAGPPVEVVNPDRSEELARLLNDELAELAAKHSKYFVAAAASLPMNKPDAAALELERAVRQLGLAGVQIYSNVLGKPVDLPEFRPIFQLLSEYDVPILLHPARSRRQADYLTEDTSKYLLWQVLGWPYETSAAAARIVFSGILDEYPNLRIIMHHSGGLIPFFAARIETLYKTFERLLVAEMGQRLRKPVLQYFASFYADTATVSTASIECACQFFGTQHVLFGTDMPFDGEGGRWSIRQTGRAIQEARLSDEDRNRIFYQNFEAMFRVSVSSPAVRG